MDTFRIILTYEQPAYFVDFVAAHAKTVLTEPIKVFYNEIIKRNTDVPREIFFKWFALNSGLTSAEVEAYKSMTPDISVILTEGQTGPTGQTLSDYKKNMNSKSKKAKPITVKKKDPVPVKLLAVSKPKVGRPVKAPTDQLGQPDGLPGAFLNKSLTGTGHNFPTAAFQFTGILMFDFQACIEKMYPIIVRVNRVLTGKDIADYILEAVTSLKSKISIPGLPGITYTITNVQSNARLIYFLIDIE
jgi:hypothetical protein